MPPPAGTSSLELIDISGRRVAQREVGSLGAGRHAVVLANGARIPPGVYVVRLGQGTNVGTARAVVMR
ncbi:MAG: hypothetical protein DMD82_11310 [Candidatus Rokuibacteriota bacterium]|nr:MAG: hypothetical protein DMD82_11310 [Candidatus Rokubacteria bacterium]